MTTFNVFVYGTLRRQGALADILPADSHALAVLPDFTMFEYAGGAYPIIMSTPGRVVPVVGDLLVVSDAEALVAVADMECRAGYEMRWLDVRRCADGETFKAITFVWEHVDDDLIGREVPSGDWLSHEMIGAARRVSGPGSIVFGDDS